MSSSENFAARLALRSGGGNENVPLGQRLATLKHLKRLFQQIWRTSRPLTAAAIGLRLLRAVQPLLLLYVGKLIIDEVVLQTGMPSPGPGFSDWLASGRLATVAELLALEFALVLAGDLLSRGASLADSLLAELHSNTVSMELMQHAAGLDLRHFESSEYQDRLERARRQAAGRNQLLSQIFAQGQSIITILTLAAGLLLLRALADPAAADLADPLGDLGIEVQHALLPCSTGCARRSGASSNICAISAPARRPPRRSSCSGWAPSWWRASAGWPRRSSSRTAGSPRSAPSGAACSRRSARPPITAPMPISSGARWTANSRLAT